MTAGGRYLLGVVAVGVSGIGMALLSPPPLRAQVGWAVLVGLALQAPLGWWLVRSIGAERFLVLWGIGILARFTILALAGLVVVPLMAWDPGPTLGALVAVLLALLVVEILTAIREHSREDERR